MKLTGIIFLIIGGLALVFMIFDVFFITGREADVPFLSQTWPAILASFLLGAGAALMYVSKPKYRERRRREKEKYANKEGVNY
ncbi:hypothetical protein [Catalinimonas niigatensis]|uniref:hypothetical protein n=1 Tax=Catalinimonas niigatensis TaxID=1397264 RepID=UPI00266567F2|nr:hypothetical protein [Catalinimonas niigatensis]WPP51555.1 hypothetical protein PZB72_04035 [Catalinimonas niigatensis]